MKTKDKYSEKIKRTYFKPSIEKINVDNEISIFMLSPPPDPGGKLKTDHYSVNPFKFLKL